MIKVLATGSEASCDSTSGSQHINSDFFERNKFTRSRMAGETLLKLVDATKPQEIQAL